MLSRNQQRCVAVELRVDIGINFHGYISKPMAPVSASRSTNPTSANRKKDCQRAQSRMMPQGRLLRQVVNEDVTFITDESIFIDGGHSLVLQSHVY